MQYLLTERIRRTHRYRRFHPLEYGHLLGLISEMADGYIRHTKQLGKSEVGDDLDYIRAVLRALDASTDLAEEIGMIDVIEEYETLVIEGMEFDDLPKEDIHALGELGEANPRGALLSCFLKVKNHKSTRKIDYEDVPLEKSLRSIEHRLEQVEERFQEGRKTRTSKRQTAADATRPSRRWFKGLGKIAQGSALTLADVCLAAGILVLPVDPTTQTWGAIVSSITGVGATLDGVGELRGE